MNAAKTFLVLLTGLIFFAASCRSSLAQTKQEPTTQAIDGYFVFGQSNANGRSYSSELSNEVLRHHYQTNLLYAYRERSFKDGSRPEDVPLGKIQPDSKDRVGVEVTLGRHLAAHSPQPVMLVKFCSGGTSIKNFLPEEDNLFAPMLSFLREQKQLALELGYEVNWKGAPELKGKGGWSFKPRGRLQYDAGFVSAPDSTGRSDGFGNEVRRARLGVQGDMPGGFGYKFELDFDGTEVAITDAILTYETGDLDITVGQHNNFQGLEELTLFRVFFMGFPSVSPPLRSAAIVG